MITVAFAASILFSLCSSELSCKGVEFSTSSSDKKAYPLDVCWSKNNDALGRYRPESYWYYCDSDATVWTATYDTENCQGYPSQVAPLSDSALNITAYCDLEACQYMLKTTFYTAVGDCNEDTSTTFSTWTSVPYVSGYCNDEGSYSQRYTCSVGVNSSQIHWYRANGNDDCSETNPDWITDITFADSHVFGTEIACSQVISGSASSSGTLYSCATADFVGLLNAATTTNAGDQRTTAAVTSDGGYSGRTLAAVWTMLLVQYVLRV